MFDSKKAVAPKRDVHWISRASFGLVCVLVIGFFAWSAQPGYFELANPGTEDSSYNLLVRGFRAGQLNVKREAPAGLAQLADPCDPAVNAPYLKDVAGLSYYQGKLYLYFGVTPAVVLFWPYAALTGQYLSDRTAVVIFFALGFLTAAVLLRAVWRRYFPEVKNGVLAAGVLALGLALGTMMVVSPWSDVNEVAATGGFAFTMLALAAIWGALQGTKRQVIWLLLASLAYGLAIGARPSLLFGGIILLLPVIQAWRAATEPSLRRRAVGLAAAAVGPITLVGLGLMLYNALRFDNPLELGWHYQLQDAYRPGTAQPFGLHYLWFNFRYYFLEPMRWSGHFPFLQPVRPPMLPSGYVEPGRSYGGIIPVIYPLVWLVLAAPLVGRSRQKETVSGSRWFVAAVVLQFMVCASTLCLFFSADSRYGLDFLPALMLLAVVGIFGLERAMADSPGWRRMARWGWGLLLAWSVIFDLLVSVEAHAKTNFYAGNFLVHQGRAKESFKFFQKALALEPESAAFHDGLGTAYYQTKRLDEAMTQYQKALDIDPDDEKSHYNLGLCLLQKGQVNEVITHFQKVLEIKPDFAEAHYELGTFFGLRGQLDEAGAQFKKAIELKPDYANAHGNLAKLLAIQGKLDEAVKEYQRTLALIPNSDLAHFRYGQALQAQHHFGAAKAEFQKALALNPRNAEACVNLAWLLATCPESSLRDGKSAVERAQQAEQLGEVELPQLLDTLAAAYAEAGRFDEAVTTAKRALNFPAIQNDKSLAEAIQSRLKLYEAKSPFHEQQ